MLIQRDTVKMEKREQKHSSLVARIAVPRRGLSREEAALYLGISATKFDEMRKDGRVRPPKLIDSRKVWDIGGLDEAFDALPDDGLDQAEGEWKAEL
jgi:hypothetical protein